MGIKNPIAMLVGGLFLGLGAGTSAAVFGRVPWMAADVYLLVGLYAAGAVVAPVVMGFALVRRTFFGLSRGAWAVLIVGSYITGVGAGIYYSRFW